MDIKTYVLCKRYVEDSLAGAGALSGKSAYEIAKDHGFIGSEEEWLVSLQGSSPSIGTNGNWFIGGVDTGVIASPNLLGYATEEYVNAQIESLNLNQYVTNEELATELGKITIPDIDGFITQEDLDNAIATIDLSNYVTQENLNDAIANIDLNLEGYATEDFVNQKIAEAQLGSNLDNYYTKEETKRIIAEEVTTAVNNIGVASDNDLGLVKSSDEISVDENGALGVKSVTTDKIINGTEDFVIHGGSATSE